MITYKIENDGTVLAIEQINNLTAVVKVGHTASTPADIDQAWIIDRFGTETLAKVIQDLAAVKGY